MGRLLSGLKTSSRPKGLKYLHRPPFDISRKWQKVYYSRVLTDYTVSIYRIRLKKGGGEEDLSYFPKHFYIRLWRKKRDFGESRGCFFFQRAHQFNFTVNVLGKVWRKMKGTSKHEDWGKRKGPARQASVYHTGVIKWSVFQTIPT